CRNNALTRTAVAARLPTKTAIASAGLHPSRRSGDARSGPDLRSPSVRTFAHPTHHERCLVTATTCGTRRGQARGGARSGVSISLWLTADRPASRDAHG